MSDVLDSCNGTGTHINPRYWNDQVIKYAREKLTGTKFHIGFTKLFKPPWWPCGCGLHPYQPLQLGKPHKCLPVLPGDKFCGCNPLKWPNLHSTLVQYSAHCSTVCTIPNALWNFQPIPLWQPTTISINVSATPEWKPQQWPPAHSWPSLPFILGAELLTSICHTFAVVDILCQSLSLPLHLFHHTIASFAPKSDPQQPVPQSHPKIAGSGLLNSSQCSLAAIDLSGQLLPSSMTFFDTWYNPAEPTSATQAMTSSYNYLQTGTSPMTDWSHCTKSDLTTQ